MELRQQLTEILATVQLTINKILEEMGIKELQSEKKALRLSVRHQISRGLGRSVYTMELINILVLLFFSNQTG